MITFRVYGIPQTKGSTKAFMRPGMRYPVVTNDNIKNKSWSQAVSSVAQMVKGQYAANTPLDGPLSIRLSFYLPRPKSAPRCVHYPTKRPDLDKMVRSVKDALTGVLYRDDSQVVHLNASKSYASDPGVEVTLEAL